MEFLPLIHATIFCSRFKFRFQNVMCIFSFCLIRFVFVDFFDFFWSVARVVASSAYFYTFMYTNVSVNFTSWEQVHTEAYGSQLFSL